MKRYEDLPVRLTIVIGSHSGGTTAVAGALTKNGFYNQYDSGSFEVAPSWHHLFAGPWFHAPRRKPNEQNFDDFARWARRYKDAAMMNGCKRAVQKWPNEPMWIPEMFQGHCGISVEPLLVWRDPKDIAASMKRRWANKFHHISEHTGCVRWIDIARQRMRQIEKLRDTYGWPMWVFDKDTLAVDKLEDIVGCSLPVRFMDPEKVV